MHKNYARPFFCISESVQLKESLTAGFGAKAGGGEKLGYAQQ